MRASRKFPFSSFTSFRDFHESFFCLNSWALCTSLLAPSTSTLFYECVKALSKIGNEIFSLFSLLFILIERKYIRPRSSSSKIPINNIRKTKSFLPTRCFTYISIIREREIFYDFLSHLTFLCCFPSSFQEAREDFHALRIRVCEHFAKNFYFALRENKSRWWKAWKICPWFSWEGVKNLFISSLKVLSAIMRRFISHVHLRPHSINWKVL